MSAGAEEHCTAACPEEQLTARDWRSQWDRDLESFYLTAEGEEFLEVSRFVRAQAKEKFIWNVY